MFTSSSLRRVLVDLTGDPIRSPAAQSEQPELVHQSSDRVQRTRFSEPLTKVAGKVDLLAIQTVQSLAEKRKRLLGIEPGTTRDQELNFLGSWRKTITQL